MILYFIMASITMVAVMCIYLHTSYVDDWSDYMIGAVMAGLAGVLWPIVLGVGLFVGICRGILYLLEYLNIIRRW